jgi:HEAT repeat protein
MRLFEAALIFGLAVGAVAEQPSPAGSGSTLNLAEKQRLQRLIDNLKSNHPKTLDTALQEIGRLGPKAADAVDSIAGMLTDGRKLTYSSNNIMGYTSFQVNVAAVTALGNIGGPAAKALVSALGNRDDGVRVVAVQALRSIRPPIESKHWVRILSDSNRYVRIIAARQLGKMKSVADVEALCKGMNDEDRDVRIEVAKALGQIGDPRAIDPLIAALSRTHNEKTAAASALAQIGKPAFEVLINRFESFDESTRDLAARAFQSADATREKELLLRCCISEYAQVREGALYALIKDKVPEAYAIAQRMVEDPNWNARWTAVRGLGEFAGKETDSDIRTTLLKVLREDKDPKVRSRALQSMHSLLDPPPDSFWEAIGAALDDESSMVRNTALIFWDPRLIPKISLLLKDADPSVRAEAALCLGYHHVESATADLIEQLKDESPQCAERSACALGNLGTDNAVTVLIQTMRDREIDPELRNAAVYGLCLSKNRKAINPLIDSLQDKALMSNSPLARRVLKEMTGEDFRQASE